MATFSAKLLILLWALVGLAWPVAAEEVHISGHASIVDGDTLDVGPIRIRLNGIDAPETGQTCGRADGGDMGLRNAPRQTGSRRS